VMLLAAGVGAVGLLLRQPLIVSFIAVGVLVGPSALNIVTAEAEMDLLAKMGVAVLLFLVGLRLDVQHIRQMGAVALATGLGQIALTAHSHADARILERAGADLVLLPFSDAAAEAADRLVAQPEDSPAADH